MIDLTTKPFNLSQNEIDYVLEQVKQMTTSEKIGQLFFVIGQDEKMVDLDEFIDKYKPGGMMFRPAPAADIKRQIKQIQNHSKYPLFFAANLESGGNGIISEGTWLGMPMQMAATNNTDAAFQLGNVAGYEANQVGCNMSFAPIVDIDNNFRNPITNTRTYGSDPKRVLKMAQAQRKGLEENHVIPVIKHFPGDGVDERDQHLLSSINSLSAEDWSNTYGHIYKTFIDQGISTIMIGHIYQPAWERKLHKGIADKDLRPASASKLLINGLLRKELGFNGLAMTDATAMVGYNVILPRKELLPATINAGVDMILFNKNIDEDYKAITEAVESGLISEERLNEAVTRILATKVAQNILTTDGKLGVDIPETLDLESDKHLAIAENIAKQSVTLVKDRDQLLPISPEKTPRVRLVVLGDSDDGGFKEGGKVSDLFKEELEKAGFEVTPFQMDFHEMFEEGVCDLKEKFDLAFYVANVETASNQTTTRLDWIHLMAANAPWFAKAIPTVFVSTANPYHLFDVPYLSTYINAYTGNTANVKAIIRKMTGKEAFEGISPVDPTCGDFNAAL
ncbi:glycoside hydrolase family 3 protein [Streptococcus equinus]|uniref:glycoside hydrolase family 3 protein n=1 Tax=Streptococcus equinus TaxID=1335 RepID=UPI00088FA55B|nr:glycoside hydrolase family 3 N-terminal domain-containing protein [Streptococcus equinus]SDI36959.1 beta-N-acetylhexosaminidase [Streptococcus equinus]SEP57594.1 beta-N-acetylhexosaminidase [Streptococcus equinus]